MKKIVEETFIYFLYCIKSSWFIGSNNKNGSLNRNDIMGLYIMLHYQFGICAPNAAAFG